MATLRNFSFKFALLVALALYVGFSAFFTYSYSVGPNYKNVSVDTRVNVTNSPPTVLSVIINNGATNVTLNAGSTTSVICNATVRDYNGGSTITNVSAVFFDNVSATYASPDDNNTHYTNYTTTGGCALGSFDTYTRNVTCLFTIQYYTNASMWACNVTATDPVVFVNASRTNSLTNFTHVDQLLALNVTPLINYGDLAVGDISTPQQANVTNLGNWNINVSVRGYGNTSTDGLAMYCDIGNISVQYEKYNIIGGVDLSLYTNLSNVSKQVSGLTALHQINDSQPVINTTYWILQVPPIAFGHCNGTVVFQAELS